MCSSVRFSFRVCIVFSLVLSFFVCVFCFFFLFFSLFYIFFFMFFFFFLFFFFFQAEDGIRDHCVTGVQTCAFRSDLRRFFLRRLLRDLDFRPLLDQDRVRAGRERRDDKVELAAHHAHAQHVPARDRPTLEDLGHVLLAAHDPDRFRWSEGDLLGGTGERLPEAHLVVDAYAGVPSLHAVHADHAAVRVL